MTGGKICRVCHTEKPLAEFYKQAKSRDGHHSDCAECGRAKAIEWYRANRDTVQARLTEKRRAAGVKPRAPRQPKGAYHNRMRNDPEYKRKRKEYNQKRWLSLSDESKARSRAWAAANPERTREIDRECRARNQLLHIYRNIRKRARARGMDFNIEISDIALPDVCPIFGVPFKMNATIDDYDFAPSIDRIDSNKGYVKGNVQVISRLANCMKWTATPEQLVTFAEGILRMRGK